MTSQQPDTHSNSTAPSGRRIVMDDVAIRRALMRIAHEVLERCEDLERLYLVAIPNGGVPLARQLAANFKQIADVDVGNTRSVDVEVRWTEAQGRVRTHRVSTPSTKP